MRLGRDTIQLSDSGGEKKRVSLWFKSKAFVDYKSVSDRPMKERQTKQESPLIHRMYPWA